MAVPPPRRCRVRSGDRCRRGGATDHGGRRATRYLAGVVALACGVVQAQGVAPQRSPPRVAAAGPLWISESTIDDGRRLLIVVDSATRHAAIYHVDPTAGTLTLRSARNLSWDLTLEDFNAQEPTPAALRRLLENAPAAPAR